jgi:hypothetical protein
MISFLQFDPKPLLRHAKITLATEILLQLNDVLKTN